MKSEALSLKKNDLNSKSTLKFKLLILTGELRGQSFVLDKKRIIIGRAENADVKIIDTKASREHAEITRLDHKFVITDLGSQNGVIVNDKKVVQSELVDGDRIVIGQTVFKVSATSSIIKTNEVEKLRVQDSQKSQTTKKPTFIFYIMGLILIIIFLGEDSEKEKKVKTTNFVGTFNPSNSKDVIALEKKKAFEEKKLKEKLVIYYQRGLRELREKNYFRAIQEFNLALNYSPSDGQAEYYIRKAKEELDREIESNLAKAIRDEESLKFQSALISYCAIIRLLYIVPQDPRYLNAEKQIKELELKLGMNQGEADCLKKQRSSI